MLTVLSLAHVSLQRTVIRLQLLKGIEYAMPKFGERWTNNHFLKGLEGIGLWPFSQIFDAPTAGLVAERMRRYNDTCKELNGCTCKDEAFEHYLSQGAAKAEGYMKGLCLDCVRKGKYTASEGNCRSRTCVSA